MACGSDPSASGSFCFACGAGVHPTATSCVKCGATLKKSSSKVIENIEQGKNGMIGLLAMIFGIAAVGIATFNFIIRFIPIIDFCFCLTGPIAALCGLAAIVLGIIGIVKKSSKGKAIAGLILGIVWILLAIVYSVIHLLLGIATMGLSGI
jgi:hypothetical protein